MKTEVVDHAREAKIRLLAQEQDIGIDEARDAFKAAETVNRRWSSLSLGEQSQFSRQIIRLSYAMDAVDRQIHRGMTMGIPIESLAAMHVALRRFNELVERVESG